MTNWNDTRTDLESREFSFGARDIRGREIGALALLETYVSLPGGHKTGLLWFRRAQAPYGLRVHATRNGKTFGASQSTRWFFNEAEREAELDRYLAGARKRAQKATGK